MSKADGGKQVDREEKKKRGRNESESRTFAGKENLNVI